MTLSQLYTNYYPKFKNVFGKITSGKDIFQTQHNRLQT